MKRFKLPSGHRLSKHKGACHNMHGHNYVIEVQLSTEKLDKNDMVIDFHDLKVLTNAFLDRFDHATVLNPTDRANIDHIIKQDYKLEFISLANEDPTAEVFSKYIYKALTEIFKVKNIDVYLDLVRVWESDDSMAEYSE